MSDYFVSSLCITKPNFEQFYQKQQFFFRSKYYQKGNKSKKMQKSSSEKYDARFLQCPQHVFLWLQFSHLSLL